MKAAYLDEALVQRLLIERPSLYASLLFFVAFWGPPKFRSRDPMAALSLQLDWSVLINLIVWGCVALWVFNEINRYALVRRSAPPTHSSVRWAVLLCLLLIASASVSASPLLTFYKAAQLLATVLFGYFWALRFGWADVVERMASASLVVTIGLLVAGTLFPSAVWMSGRLLGGVFGGSSSPAVLSIVFGLSGAGMKCSSVRRLAVIAGGLLLALSQVRAGYVAVAVYLVITALIGSRHLASRRLLLALVAAIPFAVVTEAWRGLAAYFVRDTGSLATLSDRIPLWAALLGVMMRESPLLGLGFYAIRPYTLAYNEGIGSGHSAYVEVLVGGGVLSLLVLVVVLALVARCLLLVARSGGDSDSQRYAQTAFGVLIVCVVLAVTSDEAVTGGVSSFALFMLPGLTSALMVKPGGRGDART